MSFVGITCPADKPLSTTGKLLWTAISFVEIGLFLSLLAGFLIVISSLVFVVRHFLFLLGYLPAPYTGEELGVLPILVAQPWWCWAVLSFTTVLAVMVYFAPAPELANDIEVRALAWWMALLILAGTAVLLEWQFGLLSGLLQLLSDLVRLLS